VDVVALDAHVHDADRAEHRRREDRQPDRVIRLAAPQPPHRLGDPQDDVDRRPGRDLRPPAHPPVQRLARRQEVDALPPGALALAAPPLAVLVAPQLEVHLRRPRLRLRLRRRHV